MKKTCKKGSKRMIAQCSKCKKTGTDWTSVPTSYLTRKVFCNKCFSGRFAKNTKSEVEDIK